MAQAKNWLEIQSKDSRLSHSIWAAILGALFGAGLAGFFLTVTEREDNGNFIDNRLIIRNIARRIDGFKSVEVSSVSITRNAEGKGIGAAIVGHYGKNGLTDISEAVKGLEGYEAAEGAFGGVQTNYSMKASLSGGRDVLLLRSELGKRRLLVSIDWLTDNKVEGLKVFICSIIIQDCTK